MPQKALRTKFDSLEISFNRGQKEEMINIYKTATCSLDFLL